MIDPAHLSERHPELAQAGRLVVGFSGGLDSSVLLHLTHRAFPGVELLALHVDHGLSPLAPDWRRHCEEQCARLGIPIITESVALSAGSEAAAREGRYAAYRRHLRRGDVLLQAHHADDQAETILFRLLRGAGVRGLAGIPVERDLAPGRLLRPLLECRRSELEAYARQHNLRWVEDESNQEDRFDRNYLRLTVLPTIERRWLNAVPAINSSGGWCREAEMLLDDLAREDLHKADEQRERIGWSIAAPQLSVLREQRRNNLLRYWMRSHDLPVPGSDVLDRVERELLCVRQSAGPVLRWSGVSLCRFRQRLYLLPQDWSLNGKASISPIPWPTFPQPLCLPNGFRLWAEPDESGPLYLPADAVLEVRFREGGEICTPHWRRHRHPLKKLLQEIALEPWLRAQVPLLYCHDSLAAVGDLWACSPYTSSSDASASKGWRLRWYRSGSIG